MATQRINAHQKALSIEKDLRAKAEARIASLEQEVKSAFRAGRTAADSELRDLRTRLQRAENQLKGGRWRAYVREHPAKSAVILVVLCIAVYAAVVAMAAVGR